MATAEALMTEHIDLWTAAVKRKSSAGRGTSKKLELYGIKKLRELILEMAVRGLLVPQDPADEPASVLLERIAAEKAELVKDKKIKKQKALPPIGDEEKLFVLPKGWKWVRLQSLITLLGDGLHGTPNYDDSGSYFFVNGNNLNAGTINIKPETKKVTTKEYEKHKKNLNSRTVLVSINGTLGKIAFYNNEPIMLGKSACYFNLGSKLSKKFIKILIESPYFLTYAYTKATGSTIKNLGLKSMNNFPLALPPLAEQHRIVAKVDELMALCDQLEQQTETNINAQQTLVETLLTAVTGNDTNAAESIALLFANFDSLFTTADSVDQLKQTILQLAVVGKLVPQDPNDEPANVLLEKIAAEKEKLIRNKIYQKTGKRLPKENLIWPKNWIDVQIGEICPSIVPNRDKPKSFTGHIPWVTLPDFPTNSFYLEHDKVQKKMSQLEVEVSSARVIPENSVLMSCVGRFGLTAINKIEVTCNQQVHGFVVLSDISAEFLSIVIKVASAKLAAIASSTTVAYLNKSKCESIQFGMPPLAEQYRIVAKVDELMTLCDQLKTRLNTAQNTQLNLADAVADQAII